MALTYRVTKTVTTHETRTLRVPTEWGMFTPAGNRRITKAAQAAMDKIEKLDGTTEAKVDKILTDFLAKWVRLWYTKSYGEAGDTDVREQVGSFHDMLADASGAYDYGSYEAWERNYEAAQARVRKERERKRAKAQEV